MSSVTTCQVCGNFETPKIFAIASLSKYLLSSFDFGVSLVFIGSVTERLIDCWLNVLTNPYCQLLHPKQMHFLQLWILRI